MTRYVAFSDGFFADGFFATGFFEEIAGEVVTPTEPARTPGAGFGSAQHRRYPDDYVSEIRRPPTGPASVVPSGRGPSLDWERIVEQAAGRQHVLPPVPRLGRDVVRILAAESMQELPRQAVAPAIEAYEARAALLRRASVERGIATKSATRFTFGRKESARVVQQAEMLAIMLALSELDD